MSRGLGDVYKRQLLENQYDSKVRSIGNFLTALKDLESEEIQDVSKRQ